MPKTLISRKLPVALIAILSGIASVYGQGGTGREPATTTNRTTTKKPLSKKTSSSQRTTTKTSSNKDESLPSLGNEIKVTAPPKPTSPADEYIKNGDKFSEQYQDEKAEIEYRLAIRIDPSKPDA